MDGEGGQDVQLTEELCVRARQVLQEPGEHLVGLQWGGGGGKWGKEGQLFPWGLALHQRRGVFLGKGGWRGVPPTYLAPWGADPQHGTTSCPDHGLELLVLIGEAEAEGEGADDVGGGLGQQQGGVKRPS